MQKLVDSLDADFEEGDKSEEDKKPTSVGLKSAFSKTDSSDSTKADAEDLVETEAKEEEVTAEGEEGKTSSEPNESKTKLDGRGADDGDKKEKEKQTARTDYEMLDELTSFLYLDEDPQPILCGYFFKIMEQLLLKQKN